MDRTLHNANNAQRILELTADTMLLIDRNGICVDIDSHCDLWFLQEEVLLGKNIFELLPERTRDKVMPVFETVIGEQRNISKNFKLVLKDETFYFKCLMYPYDDMVLCQYRDITQRSNVKRQLEQANRTLREIQKVAQIGHWTYNTAENVFHYTGYTGVLCKEGVQHISFDTYKQLIMEEDAWLSKIGAKRMYRNSTRKVSATGFGSTGAFFMCASRLICGRKCPTAVSI